jgi:YidC/Oxa1 family membrane protein insertase
MIDAIAQFFGGLLTYIYGIVPNFGAAIIIMTILVKLVTFPLNNKQIQSAKRMQQLQPEMKKIQAKYKDDKEKQNKAVTEFMKENNMNPLAGCLPLLVQFPILIGVFRLLREADLFLDMSLINPIFFRLPNILTCWICLTLLTQPDFPLTLFSAISVFFLYSL